MVNIPDYPDVTKLKEEIEKISRSLIFDAKKIAKKAGSTKSSNIVMLGAASPFID
ncbi:unnamed protein product, partial [marine sediment metagenome]